jgi:hypothetical protein
MKDEKLQWVMIHTNRSKGQTLFLYELLSKNFDELLKLETQIKNTLTYHCPSNMEEVEEIYNKEVVSSTFKFEEYGV